MDSMSIGRAITQGYGKLKPSWILKMCSLILRVFERSSSGEGNEAAYYLNKYLSFPKMTLVREAHSDIIKYEAKS